MTRVVLGVRRHARDASTDRPGSASRRNPDLSGHHPGVAGVPLGWDLAGLGGGFDGAIWLVEMRAVAEAAAAFAALDLREVEAQRPRVDLPDSERPDARRVDHERVL